MRGTISMLVLGLGALLLACVPLAAHAQVYRCNAPDGSVAFQDHPCPRRQRQKIMHVPSRPPLGYEPPPAATTLPPTVANALPSPPRVPAAAPLPMLYACVGAVNGKHYLTRHPPPPYLAPLGVMGYPPQRLSQAYGTSGGAGMSAPGETKPRIGGPAIAAQMTRVQDACAPAPKTEVCAWVRRESDQNQHKLAIAMRHAKPPLERRQKKLQDQLRNCR